MPSFDEIIAALKESSTAYKDKLAKAYASPEAFKQAFMSNLAELAPPDPRDKEATMQFAINRAMDIPGGFAGAIKAYHGSPHKFDAFDMSKIGTGEGAQAYGHGLYFAENPEVAKQYASALSARVSDEKFKLQYHRDMAKQRGDLERVKELTDKIEGSYGQNMYKTSLEWPDAAREAADPLGPQHFLDWDKPLSEQPESVKSAWQSMFGDVPEPKGPLGRTLKGLMAEEDLKAQGIPGIRYLDGGSRGTGEGSYNYVIFDDKIPRIVERNGKGLLGEPK